MRTDLWEFGTSVPTEAIDAIGNAKISGLTTTGTLGVAQTATFFDDLKVGSVNIDPTSGVITATKFVGDASGLSNIVAISTLVGLQKELDFKQYQSRLV